MRIFFLLPVLLSLAACSEPGDLFGRPTFMGSGYTYHNDLYKAPPGQAAPGIGYIYSQGKNAEVLQAWRNVAADLIGQLEGQGLSAGDIYLETPVRGDAMLSGFDHALREEFRARNYILAGPMTPVHIRYDLYRSVNAADVQAAPGDMQEFMLVLTLMQGGLPQVQVSGSYNLPAYGYRGDTEPAPVIMPPEEVIETAPAPEVLVPEVEVIETELPPEGAL